MVVMVGLRSVWAADTILRAWILGVMLLVLCSRAVDSIQEIRSQEEYQVRNPDMEDQQETVDKAKNAIAKFHVLMEFITSPASRMVLTDVKNKDIVVFMGTTKCGKSTLVNHAIGNKLVAVLNDDDEYIIKKEHEHMDGPKIGDVSVSETTIPSMWKSNRSGLREEIVDLPGFDDNRGEVQDIANAFYIREIIRICMSVKFVLLADMHGLMHTDISIFTNLIEKMHTIFPDIHILDGGTALIISKVDKKLSQEKICKKLTNDILMQEAYNIKGREWVKYFVDNKKFIAFFKVPTSAGIINDDEVAPGVLDTIYKINPIPGNKLVNVKPGIALKSKIFLLKSYAIFSNMDDYNNILKRYEDRVATYCGNISELNTKNDVLKMDEGLFDLELTVADLANRVQTAVTLSNVLDFVKEISNVLDIEINNDQGDITIKFHFLEFIETILEQNSSRIFINKLQRTIQEMLNTIKLARLVAENKMNNISLKEMEKKKKEIEDKHNQEREKYSAELERLEIERLEMIREHEIKLGIFESIGRAIDNFGGGLAKIIGLL